jgi:hypothetical protein
LSWASTRCSRPHAPLTGNKHTYIGHPLPDFCLQNTCKFAVKSASIWNPIVRRLPYSTQDLLLHSQRLLKECRRLLRRLGRRTMAGWQDDPRAGQGGRSPNWRGSLALCSSRTQYLLHGVLCINMAKAALPETQTSVAALTLPASPLYDPVAATYAIDVLSEPVKHRRVSRCRCSALISCPIQSIWTTSR